jgi:hypothetical protein
MPRQTTFEPRLPAKVLIRLGYWYGQGASSSAMAQMLNEKVTDNRKAISQESIRHMLHKADLPSPGRRKVVIPLTMECWERDMLQRHASERGIDVGTLAYRMIASGLVLDDLYDAVTDGRYEKEGA